MGAADETKTADGSGNGPETSGDDSIPKGAKPKPEARTGPKLSEMIRSWEWNPKSALARDSFRQLLRQALGCAQQDGNINYLNNLIAKLPARKRSIFANALVEAAPLSLGQKSNVRLKKGWKAAPQETWESACRLDPFDQIVSVSREGLVKISESVCTPSEFVSDVADFICLHRHAFSEADLAEIAQAILDARNSRAKKAEKLRADT